jgi:hypothetical protein
MVSSSLPKLVQDISNEAAKNTSSDLGMEANKEVLAESLSANIQKAIEEKIASVVEKKTHDVVSVLLRGVLGL